MNRDIINVLDISADANLIATGGDDNYVVIGDFNNGNIVYNMPLESRVLGVEFSQDSKFLIAFSKSEVDRLSIEKKEVKKVTYFTSVKNIHYGLSNEELYINGTLTVTGQKGLFIYNLQANQYQRILTDSDIRDFKFSYGNNMIYVMIANRILQYDASSFNVLKTFTAYSSFLSFDISSDNKFIACTTDKGQIIIFNTQDKTNSLFTTASSDPMIIKIGNDNNYIGLVKKNILKINGLNDFTTSDNTNHTLTKKLLSFAADTISTGDIAINDFVFSPDGKYVLIAGRSNSVTVWNNNIKEIGKNEPAEKTKAVVAENSDVEQVPQYDVKDVKSERDLTDDFIYKTNKDNIDKELDLRPGLFAPKGEFEKSSEYDARMNDAEKYRSSIIDFYRKKYLEQIKFQHYLDSMNVVRKLEMQHQKIKDSYTSIVLSIEKLGLYDADHEYFSIVISGRKDSLKMARNDAMTFKPNYEKARVIAHQQLKMDGTTLDTFNIYVVHPITNKYYQVGKQVKPLYVDESDVDLQNQNAFNNARNVAVPVYDPSSNVRASSNMDKEFINGLKLRKNYALFISVDDYMDPEINDLDYPNNDASNLFKTLNQRYGFTDVNSTILKDPTRTQIIEAFDKLSNEVTSSDQLLIFYAGHGYWDDKLQQGFWLPRNATKNSKAEWISNSTVRDYIRGISSKHTLLIADACFSGAIFKSRDVFSSSTKAAVELYKLPSRKAITSGTMTAVPDQSVFMKYLIKKLSENTESLLTGSSLFSEIREPIINNSSLDQVPQYGEIREAGDEGGDFIFVIE